MAHMLFPAPGHAYLDPREVVRRLGDEFAVIEADWEAGAKHVDQMIAQFQRMNMPDEVIETHRRLRGETIHIVVADELATDIAYLSFAAMPESGLLMGYHSGHHEDAARPLLERCARALDYEIQLV